MNAGIKQQPKDIVAAWVELHTDALYSWALHKTSDKEQAEDLVQDTFLAAFQQIEKFRGDSNAKTWLLGILNKKIAAFYRKKYRNQSLLQPAGKPGDTVTSIFFDDYDNWKKIERPVAWIGDDKNLLDDKEFNEALAGCLESLPERSRDIILLKFIEQRKGELVCQELDIAATNFWQILHRAKLMLRKCLDHKWFNA